MLIDCGPSNRRDLRAHHSLRSVRQKDDEKASKAFFSLDFHEFLPGSILGWSLKNCDCARIVSSGYCGRRTSLRALLGVMRQEEIRMIRTAPGTFRKFSRAEKLRFGCVWFGRAFIIH